MKKLSIMAFATLIFASCSKDYTCDCVDPKTKETNQMVFKTNKKAHAYRLCDDWATRVRTAIPEKNTYDCKLK